MSNPHFPRIAWLGTLALVPCALAAQSSASPADVSNGGAPVPRISLLADAPAATMGMKLEKTFFKVDVLAVTVRVDRGAAAGIGRVISGFDRYERELEDAVVEQSLSAGEAVVELEFLRTVSLDQFLGGVAEDMSRAVGASWLAPEDASMLLDSLPTWFGFLEERKIRKGDRLLYHVEGDTLRTVFWGHEEGAVLLDQTDIGRPHVMALLGAYFAPASSFRKKLVESLWKGWDPRNP